MSISESAPSAVGTTPLLYLTSQDHLLPAPTERLSNAGCFFLILRQRRVISSLLVSIMLSTVYNSFNATLALHVEEVFYWGPREVGFLFLALVGPSVVLGPAAGWLRDLISVRWPTIVGTGLTAPFYIVLGWVGSDTFPRMQGDLGKEIFVGALLLMGTAIELTAGMCIIEGTRMLSLSQCPKHIMHLLISMAMP